MHATVDAVRFAVHLLRLQAEGRLRRGDAVRTKPPTRGKMRT